MTIGQAISELAAAEPDAFAVRIAQTDGHGFTETWTRRELDLATNRIARSWIAQGIAVDELVTVCLPNSADVVLACVAAWKAGATPQPLSPRLPSSERQAVLDLARPRLVIDGPLDRYENVNDGPLPPLAATSWKAPTSSGSTGRPKLIRAAASAHVDPQTQVAPFVPRAATQLIAGPLVHAAPFVYAFRGLMTGHELLVMPSFDAVAWLRLAPHASWAVLAPSTMQRIAQSPGFDEAALDLDLLHVGARCPQWVKRQWIGRLGAERVWEVYAGTESQGLAMVRGDEWLEHPGTVGRAAGGSRFLIVRPDGSPCEPGEPGEILMRRDRETYRYVGAEPQIRDGWHTLGDVGHLDAEGYLFVGDRLMDVTRLPGGVQVHPADVEEVLDAHPEVVSSVVVGRSSGDAGTVLHAVVESTVDSAQRADLVESLQERVSAQLPDDHRPRSWEIVTQPLRDEAGKVRRSAWRA